MTYHRRHKIYSTLVSLLILLILLALKNGWIGPKPAQLSTNVGFYSISHFIDGDTIAVNMNGHVEKVRFIGVDTPETHKPNTPVQCYGPQAADYTKSQIGSSGVRLVSDSLSTDRDRYGRLLRYVYLPNGSDLNEELVKTGHAFYYPYFPFTKSGVFSSDEQTAISTKVGLWGSCTPTPSDNGGYKMDEPAPQAT